MTRLTHLALTDTKLSEGAMGTAQLLKVSMHPQMAVKTCLPLTLCYTFGMARMAWPLEIVSDRH